MGHRCDVCVCVKLAQILQELGHQILSDPEKWGKSYVLVGGLEHFLLFHILGIS